MSYTDKKLLALALVRNQLTDYERELISKGQYTFTETATGGVIEL